MLVCALFIFINIFIIKKKDILPIFVVGVVVGIVVGVARTSALGINGEKWNIKKSVCLLRVRFVHLL